MAAAPDPSFNWETVSAVTGAVAAAGILWAALVARSAARSAQAATELAAQAAADAAATTLSHALITSIPLVVPTVYKSRAFVKNRGHSEALNIEWRIEAQSDKRLIASDKLDRLLQVNRDATLYKPESGLVQIVRDARAEGGVLVSCSYAARWGEKFTITREVDKERNGTIRLFDSRDEEIQLSIPPGESGEDSDNLADGSRGSK